MTDTPVRLTMFHCQTANKGALIYGRASDTGAVFHPSTRMQATLCPGESSRNSGSIRAHSSIASGQRVRKRHPDGGLRAVGTSPFKMIRSRLAFGSGTGIAESKAWVYGCRGFL